MSVFLIGICRAEEPPLAPDIVSAQLDALQGSRRPEENPFGWLMHRREQIVSQLIAGLSGRPREVARQCLQILDKVAPRPEIRDALIPIAKNHEHHLSLLAMWSLRHYADDTRVRRLLEEAYADKNRLQFPYHRVMVALGLEQPQVAAGLLLEHLSKGGGGVDDSTVFERLGEIGATTDVPGLKDGLVKLLNGPKSQYWFPAARLALARAAPAEYPLTDGQRTFLTEVERQWWMTPSEKDAKWAELAQLDRDDLRPLVMRALATEYPGPALAILQAWGDRAALPALELLIAKGRNSRLYASAYLEIADTDAAVEKLAALVAIRKPAFVLYACMRSGIPVRRKLKLARVFRGQLGLDGSAAVAGAVSQAGADTESLVIPLMAEETDLAALAAYAKLAARFDTDGSRTQLYRALKIALTIAGRGGETFSTRFNAARIMDAAAACPLPGSGPLADGLLVAKVEHIRLAAANLAAKCGGNRSEAIRVLLDVLKLDRSGRQQMASDYLRHLPPLGVDEKAEREETLLNTLGGPAEVEALHALPNCSGQRSAELLTPLLNDQDFW